MKVSELIEKLLALKDKHGDLECVMMDSERLEPDDYDDVGEPYYSDQFDVFILMDW